MLLEADYSQMELRVLAHFSQDPALLHAFQHDIDLHVRTAARVLGIAEDDVTDRAASDGQDAELRHRLRADRRRARR